MTGHHGDSLAALDQTHAAAVQMIWATLPAIQPTLEQHGAVATVAALVQLLDGQSIEELRVLAAVALAELAELDQKCEENEWS